MNNGLCVATLGLCVLWEETPMAGADQELSQRIFVAMSLRSRERSYPQVMHGGRLQSYQQNL
jgi:hypothetical protein